MLWCMFDSMLQCHSGFIETSSYKIAATLSNYVKLTVKPNYTVSLLHRIIIVPIAMLIVKLRICFLIFNKTNLKESGERI